MFSVLHSLLVNTATIVVTPIELVATLANAVVQPVAEVVEDLAKDIKDRIK